MKKKYVAVHNLPRATPPIDWSGTAKALVDAACWFAFSALIIACIVVLA